MGKIYLDNSATTKISEEALERYIAVSRELYGNPSSLHAMGYEAERIIESTRDLICQSLGAKGSKVVFTASGTEANNLAIIGRAMSKERYKRGAKIITTMGEHASVDAPLKLLSDMGFTIVRIPTHSGAVDMDKLERELTKDVILVTMMMVNNETGAIYDTYSVAGMMKRKCPEALLHIDATQSYLKIPFTKAKCGADMITISSHKIEGPKGVGALVIDGGVIKSRGISPLILGGGQEGGLRSGTENVPGIAAFGEAVRLGHANLQARYKATRELRDYLIERLSDLSEISITNPEMVAPHIVNITLPSIKSETMLHHLSALGIYVSSGSACSSHGSHLSSALISYGRTQAEADSSIRISLCHRNTKEDIDALIDGLRLGLTKLARVK